MMGVRPRVLALATSFSLSFEKWKPAKAGDINVRAPILLTSFLALPSSFSSSFISSSGCLLGGVFSLKGVAITFGQDLFLLRVTILDVFAFGTDLALAFGVDGLDSFLADKIGYFVTVLGMILV